jgi:outer membrane protein assembly factor BamD (BamD/ComL family)
MKNELLVRIAVIAGLLNIAATATVFVGRPDLAVRESAEKLFVVAFDLEKEGKFEEAAGIYRDIFYNMSPTLIAPRAGIRLAEIYRRRLFDVKGARAIFEEVAQYKESAYAENAGKELEFMNRHWGEDGAALTVWYKASAAYRSNKHDEALGLLGQIVKDHSESSLKPLAMIWTAKVFEKMNRPQDANLAARAFLGQYPNDAQADEARRIIRVTGR